MIHEVVRTGPDPFRTGPDPSGSGMGPDGSGWVRMGPDGSGWVRMGPEWIPSCVYRFLIEFNPRAAGRRRLLTAQGDSL